MNYLRVLSCTILIAVLLFRADVAAGPSQSPLASPSWRAAGVGQAAGGFPADPQIAVSSTHVVITARAIIGYYTKAGTKLQTLSASSFFSPMNLLASQGVNAYFDLRAIYDPHRGRFIIGALAYNSTACSPTCTGDVHSLFVVGISKTQDPTAGWWLYWFYAVNKGAGYQAGDQSDYPILGVDKDAIFGTNKVCNGGAARGGTGCSYRYWHILWRNATQMSNGVGGGSLTGGDQYGLTYPSTSIQVGLIQPVIQHKGSGIFTDNPSYAFFVTNGQSNTQIIIWGLSNAFTSPQFTGTTVTVNAFTAPPNAQQNGTSNLIHMNNLGNSPQKAISHNGYLWIVFQDAASWSGTGTPYDAVRYIKLCVDQFPRIDTSSCSGYRDLTVEGRNTIDDPQGQYFYTGWPAVEVNNIGEAVIVFSRTGPSIYPEVRYMVHYPLDAAITPSRLLKAGEAPYTANCDPTACWLSGDLGGASADPNDQSVWVAHAYASSTSFEIWVGQVLGSGSVPVTGTDLAIIFSTIGAATLLVRRWRFRDNHIKVP